MAVIGSGNERKKVPGKDSGPNTPSDMVGSQDEISKVEEMRSGSLRMLLKLKLATNRRTIVTLVSKVKLEVYIN